VLPWTALAVQARALVAQAPAVEPLVVLAESVQVAAVPLRSGLEEKMQGCIPATLGQTLAYWPVRDLDQAATGSPTH